MKTAGCDDLLRLDADGRRAALVEFERPLVLEAGAGTGKTTTLVGRILSWTLGRGWNVTAARAKDGTDKSTTDPADWIAATVLEGVSAITFTEAAAAEMATRVARGLAAVADGRLEELPGFDVTLLEVAGETPLEQRAAALLGHLDLLEVCTIHAFCHRRLMAHPLELGLHPAFRIDAELKEVEETVRGVVEERVRAAYAAGVDSPLLDAAEFGVGPKRLAEALLRLTEEAVPATALGADPFSRERLEAARDELRDRVETFLATTEGRLRTVTRGQNAGLVAGALSETQEFLATVDIEKSGAAADMCRGLAQIWEGKLLDRLAKWGKNDFTKSERTALGERATTLQPQCLPLRNRLRHLSALEPERTEAFRLALGPMLEETERALKATGLTHFAHILVETLRLFTEHPEVLAAERRAIRQLLVDEFQDTDLVQCEVVSLLAFGSRPEERPGLFVVGDPKQCIYGWRNADLDAYDAFCAKVQDEGGHRYQLVQNFRSAPAILDEVERSIQPVMHEQRGLQPAFTTLEPSESTRHESGFRTDHWAPVEGWDIGSAEMLQAGSLDISRSEAIEIEAEAVARDIGALHREQDVAWNDCGVLFRAMSHLEQFLEAFRRNGVPFAVTSDKQYFRRREIIEAAALVRTIVNPTDQLALVTWMRSALVGVPDAAFIPLWRHGFPELAVDLDRNGYDTSVRRAATETAGDIPGLSAVAGWEENLLANLTTLARLRRAFREDPADLFIERLRRSTLVEVSEAARFLGQYRIANLDRFFRRLRQAIVESRGNIQPVLRALRRSVSEAHEAEEALPKEAAEDAVQVMTIHKAKGLEFDHVYLVQIDAGTWGAEAKSTDADRRWGPFGPEEYALFDSPTLGFDRVRERREHVAAAEQVRLLYVALTRAKQRVVLSGRWSAKPGRTGGAAPTFLALFGQRPDLPGEWLELATSTLSKDGWVDAGGIRWKFPSLGALEEEFEVESDPASLPSRSRLEVAARQLSKLSDAATERMQRPIFGAASVRERQEPEVPTFGAEGRAREAALEVGSAIHAALERWDLDADPDGELAAQRAQILSRLHQKLSGRELDQAIVRVGELLDRLRDGDILAKLRRLGNRIVARELPLLLPSSVDSAGPLVGISGIADLVLRDPDDDRLVVVDYKTDEIEDDETLAARAEHYEGQLATYSLALQQALVLDYEPRRELWFIWPDTVWRSS